jgi:hypothetical protein
MLLATYFDKSKIDTENSTICGNTAISTFPILHNEEFAFNYNERHGVELEFGLRDSKKGKGEQ